MRIDPHLYPVLSPFFTDPEAIQRVEHLGGAGGFSGASFWQIHTPDGRWCLRRWPKEHPDRTRLRWIHRVLIHAVDRGLTTIPLLRRTGDDDTIVEHGGYLWELSRWMDGEATYWSDPRPEKLSAAIASLAAFHQITATCPFQPLNSGPSPGIAERSQLLGELTSRQLSHIDSHICDVPGDDLRTANMTRLARHLIDLFRVYSEQVETSLAAAGGLVVPLQICIRDIWHDHVLFQRNEVSGIVDFGAMRVESVAADIARLVGSLVSSDQEQWRWAIECYAATRPLSHAEKSLIRVFDQSFVLLSGMNWLRWIYIDGRRFEQPARVLTRLDEIAARLRSLTATRE